MIEVLVWLARVESLLADSLVKGGPASARSESLRRLRKVSMNKRRLARETLSAVSRIRASSRRAPTLPGLKGLMDDVDDSFSYLVAAIGSGALWVELADAFAAHELLKWNGLILAIGNHVREDCPEGMRVLVSAQRHKRALESFIESAASRQSIFKVRAAEPVWRERLLFIGDSAPGVKLRARPDCVVETADKADAIEVLRQRYYGAIIADEDLTGLKSSGLLRRAAREFPGIEERMLFLYGGHDKAAARGAARGGRRLHNSEPPERILEELWSILDR